MQHEVELVLYVTRVWQVFLSLFGGILLGTCVAAIVLVCWHKVFRNVLTRLPSLSS